VLEIEIEIEIESESESESESEETPSPSWLGRQYEKPGKAQHLTPSPRSSSLRSSSGIRRASARLTHIVPAREPSNTRVRSIGRAQRRRLENVRRKKPQRCTK
jgi:hypothetical protein